MPENYRALTRTYRPETFDEIVSQNHVSETLKNAIKKNRLAHAYMFCGPRGVGKTTMARVLARTVNEIDSSVDGEALNRTLNVVEIDAASNNSVDDIRDLREKVRIPPQTGRFKIYIIDEVHMLSKAAFNALLKTLEEPPDHIIFIFATTEPHKVLPTILSRVQRFDFKRLRVNEIVNRLKEVSRGENIEIDNESLHVIAKKADGAMRDALGLLDQAIAFCGTEIRYEELLNALNVVSTERMFEVMQVVKSKDAPAGLELINDVLQEGHDIQEFLISLNEHLRNLYIAKNSDKMYLVEASEETKKQYLESSKAFSQDDLLRMMHIVSKAQFQIKNAHQPRIQFEMALLKLVHMERTQNLQQLLTGLEKLKKKLSDNRSPGANGKSNGSTVTSPEPNHSQRSNDEASINFKDTPQPNSIGNTSQKKSSGKGDADTVLTAEEPTGEVVENVNYQQNNKEDTDFFGKPSLSKLESEKCDHNGKIRVEKGSNSTTEIKKKPSEISMKEIRDCWDNFTENIKNSLPQMLYYQMLQVEPAKLKNDILYLTCNDDFACKIIEENRRDLAKILEKLLGVFLRFKCNVRTQKPDNEENMSPYERFKKLQERDPKIKTLVELFGAELDYNLER